MYWSTSLIIKADMKIYISLEMEAIFFLANLCLKQGTSSEYMYVMVDFICMGLLDLFGTGERIQNEKF